MGTVLWFEIVARQPVPSTVSLCFFLPGRVVASPVTFPSQPIQGCVCARPWFAETTQIGWYLSSDWRSKSSWCKGKERKGQKLKWLCLRCNGKNARSPNELPRLWIELWTGKEKDKEKGTDKDEVELGDSDYEELKSERRRDQEAAGA